MAGTARKIFISYARADSVELAQRLRRDLAAQGYSPWLDTDRINGGASWTTAVETALDEADVVLALMTRGSYISKICRAEQLRALRKGKCVIPLLAQRAADIPLYLEAKNYRDFSAAEAYDERFCALLDDIQAGNGVSLKEEFRRTYVTAPPLPENFVARPEALRSLRDAVIRERHTPNLPLTALIGMGGIGKTRLAQTLCRDEVVQQAFPDGVVWVTAGKEPAYDLVTQLREVGKALNDDPELYDADLAARNQYKTAILGKAALIVLDDVWSARDIEPFRAESPRSALLFTTRDVSIAAAVGALEHPAGALTREESRAVLARWSAMDAGNLPVEADALIAECGRLPLALTMVGAMLRGKPPVLWKRYLGFLRDAELEKIRAQFPDYPYPNLFRAIQVSVEELDAPSRDRYLALAVLLDNMPARPAIQQTLWGMDEGEAAETAEKFIDLSLAQRESDGVSILLHGLQLDYVRSQYPDREALALIHGAVRLARRVLAADPAQFESQMAARLLAHQDQPGIQRFMARLAQSAKRPWLRSITPTLTPPGGPLLYMIQAAGPFDIFARGPAGISAMAVTAALIVSAAARGGVLTLWDLENGGQIRTLSGHSDRIVSLAVTPDGQIAVSASVDKTIRMWNLNDGQTFRTIAYDATALALMPDPRKFIAGSSEGAVTIWDAETGEITRTLAGCDSSVVSVAVALEGRYAIACGGGKTYVWDLQLEQAPRIFPEYRGAAAVLPGSGLVASAGDKAFTIWDLEKGETVLTIAREGSVLDKVAALPDGCSVIYAYGYPVDMEGILEIADAATGNVRLKLSCTAGRVVHLAVTPDGRRVLTSTNIGEIQVWDLGGRQPVSVAPRHTRPVRRVAITADPHFAASIAWDCSLMWDLERGDVVYEFGPEWGLHPLRESWLGKIPGPWNRFEALLPDGRAIAATIARKLQIRNLSTGEVEMPVLSGHEERITAVKATVDGRLAVSASADGIVKIWDVQARKEIAKLTGHSGEVDLAISDESRRIVSGSLFTASTPTLPDRSVKVWDLDSGRLLHTMEGHTAAVSAVAMMPGGARAVSTAQDHTLRVWDLETGAMLTAFTAENALMACAVTPDGLTIVAGEVTGAVHILRVEGMPPTPISRTAEPDRPDPAGSILEQAIEAESQTKYEMAEGLYRLVIELRVFLLGTANPLVPQGLNYLALSYIAREQYDKAEPLLLKALAMYEHIRGPSHPDVAANLNNLGYLYAKQGAWSKAEPPYTRSVAIQEHEPGTDRSNLASGLENLACVLRQLGRDAESGPLRGPRQSHAEHGFGRWLLITSVQQPDPFW
jgi:WD40 repeat protein